MTWLNPWRVQRRPSPKPCVRRFIPRLEPLERRDVPAVTYGGGALLQNVEAQAIYYGSQWTNNSTEAAESGRFEGFLQYVVNSPYMDMLTNAGYDVGRGSWNQGVVSEANLPNGSTLADATIQSTIQSYISSGSVQNWNADRLYVVFVQAGVVVTSGAGSSRNEPNGFVGYHNSFAGRTAQGGAAQIRYAVVVTPGGGYNGYSSTLPTFDQMTSIASHELAEAVTDPDLNNGWRYYRTGNEIGDVFANDDVYLNHYVVQTEAGLGDNPIVPFTETFAAGEFAGDGVWRPPKRIGVATARYSTTANASVLDADANGDVVGDFPGAGVYRYEDATGWVQLTPADASQIAMSGAGIVLAEFVPGRRRLALRRRPRGLAAADRGQRLAGRRGPLRQRGGRAAGPGRVALRRLLRVEAAHAGGRLPDRDRRQRRGRRRVRRPGRLALRQRRLGLAAADHDQRVAGGRGRRRQRGRRLPRRRRLALRGRRRLDSADLVGRQRRRHRGRQRGDHFDQRQRPVALRGRRRLVSRSPEANPYQFAIGA